MPRRRPPEGYITAGEALEILGPMLYKYVARGALKRYGPETLKHKYYKRSEVEAIHASEEAFFEKGEMIPPTEKNNTTFARATPEDMQGVYEIAKEVFSPGTTTAEQRAACVAKCLDGNYIVKEYGEVVAFIHIQPLRPDRLREFVNGKLRGWEITAEDIDCFVPGNPTDVLIKSMAATRKYGASKSLYYTQRLLLGTSHELAKLASQGIILHKIFATSETETGIALSIHAQMKRIKRLKAADPEKNEPGRYAFELEVDTSDIPLLKEYRQAIRIWQEQQQQPTKTRPPTPRSPRPAPTIQTSKRALTLSSNLPDGQVIATVFAQRHFPETKPDLITRLLQTLRENGKVPMIEGSYKMGKGSKARAKYALDAAGRHAFYEATHEREGFEDCVDCPH